MRATSPSRAQKAPRELLWPHGQAQGLSEHGDIFQEQSCVLARGQERVKAPLDERTQRGEEEKWQEYLWKE